MLKNNENQSLQDILNQYKAPYLERAEEIKKFFPVEEASEKLQELHQLMDSDPMIKGIVDLALDGLMHEGIAAVSISADGAVDFHSKADIFKPPQ
ncbi:hypothetical protein [Acinetobacter pittii]|uniref:hypothetical protein n=1 Tax=Acinetobacter pittii TaxID=48296 RepID=UPI00300AC71D